jgi:hypothetical protein
MNLRLISSQRQRDCKRVPENPGPGTYILVLCLPNLACVQVGKLDDLKFPAGFYLYIGSALGRGGVSGRLKHHWQGPSSLIFEFYPYQEGPGYQIDSCEGLKLVAGLFNVDPEIGPFDMDDFAHFVEART